MHTHLAQTLRLHEARNATVKHEADHLAILDWSAIVELADEHGGIGVWPVGDEGL